MKGNPDAIEFVLALHDVVETWDDIIDQDQQVRPTAINKAFYAAMVTIPRNRFYNDNFQLLSPIIEGAILDWYAANEFEKQKKFEMAWALANAGLSVTVMCARIIGGPEWATSVNIEFREITEPMSKFVLERTNGVD